MRPSLAVLPLVLIAGGCQRAATPAAANNSGAVDINGAAEQAQGDIDTYASNSLQTPSEAAASAPLPPTPTPAPTPAPSAAPAPFDPPAPGEPGGLPDDRTPVSEAPFTPESAQGAANVVQTYYALLEEGKYAQARALWGQGGAASGMGAAAFAASFAKYAEYHANIGAPGRIDAGAGQRYVTVPVQVYGRMKDGGHPFNMRGDVTLHRTADIDGATAEQKSWHISATNLKPTQAESGASDPGGDDAATPPAANADYRCDSGYAFHVAFDNRAHTGIVSVGGKAVAVLDEQRTGSGIWYKGGGYELRGKGRQADFTRPGKPSITCTAR